MTTIIFTDAEIYKKIKNLDYKINFKKDRQALYKELGGDPRTTEKVAKICKKIRQRKDRCIKKDPLTIDISYRLGCFMAYKARIERGKKEKEEAEKALIANKNKKSLAAYARRTGKFWVKKSEFNQKASSYYLTLKADPDVKLRVSDHDLPCKYDSYENEILFQGVRWELKKAKATLNRLIRLSI